MCIGTYLNMKTTLWNLSIVIIPLSQVKKQKDKRLIHAQGCSWQVPGQESPKLSRSFLNEKSNYRRHGKIYFILIWPQENQRHLKRLRLYSYGSTAQSISEYSSTLKMGGGVVKNISARKSLSKKDGVIIFNGSDSVTNRV